MASSSIANEFTGFRGVIPTPHPASGQNQADNHRLRDELRHNCRPKLGAHSTNGRVCAQIFRFIAQVLRGSTYTGLAEKAFLKYKFEELLAELNCLPPCELPILVKDLDLSDLTKTSRIQYYLGSIDKIQNQDLKNSLILCVVSTITNLYLAKSSSLPIILQALHNALRRG